MMKKSQWLVIAIIFTLSMSFSTDSKRSISIVDVKTLDGKMVSTATFNNDGKPMIISFWATWCKPCIQELNTIAEVYEDWQEETGVKIIAISIDNSRTANGVLPMVNGKDWEYEVYLDENADFKRSMGVSNVPHTFLVDGEGKIVWEHTTFQPGDELELIELVRKLNRGEDISQH